MEILGGVALAVILYFIYTKVAASKSKDRTGGTGGGGSGGGKGDQPPGNQK
jgi:uncharacterized membrane protein